MLLRDFYKSETKNLESLGFQDARYDILLFIESLYNIGLTEIISRDIELDEGRKTLLQSMISRRKNYEPVQYILKKTSFLGLEIELDENVLIPRFDSERLVEKALSLIKKNESVLDMCTGSGILALAIKKQMPNAVVCATDISEKALEIARKNARLNELEVEFVASDLFENLKGRCFDIIVSNPPYIRTGELNLLSNEVKKEPRLALDGGADGLVFYREIAAKAVNYLKKGGRLIFEIGHDQKDEVFALLQKNYRDIEIGYDYGGLPRTVSAREAIYDA